MFQVMWARHKARKGLACESFLWKFTIILIFKFSYKLYFYWNINYYGLLEHCGLIR